MWRSSETGRSSIMILPWTAPKKVLHVYIMQPKPSLEPAYRDPWPSQKNYFGCISYIPTLAPQAKVQCGNTSVWIIIKVMLFRRTSPTWRLMPSHCWPGFNLSKKNVDINFWTFQSTCQLLDYYQLSLHQVHLLQVRQPWHEVELYLNVHVYMHFSMCLTF